MEENLRCRVEVDCNDLTHYLKLVGATGFEPATTSTPRRLSECFNCLLNMKEQSLHVSTKRINYIEFLGYFYAFF